MIRIKVEPIRPRAATVVAVVWLYLSVSWLILSLLVLLGGIQLVRLAGGNAGWMGGLPAFVCGIAVAAGLGLHGALDLLKLRGRGRQWLEIANWLTFGIMLMFTLDVCRAFAMVPSYYGTSTSFEPSRAWLPFVMGLLFCLPFGVMALKLRSQEVRYAIRDAEARRMAI